MTVICETGPRKPPSPTRLTVKPPNFLGKTNTTDFSKSEEKTVSLITVYETSKSQLVSSASARKGH